MIIMEVTLLTLEEVAEKLRVRPRTVKRYIAQGKLEAVRVGIGYRVKADSLARYIERNTIANEPEA